VLWTDLSHTETSLVVALLAPQMGSLPLDSPAFSLFIFFY